MPGGGRRGERHERRRLIVTLLVTVAVAAGACGSRLNGQALALAEGAGRSATTGPSSAGAPSSAGVSGPSASASAGASGSGPAPGAASAALAGAASAGGGTGGSSACSAADDGGATDTGVTATQITVGNITSITGVAPGLTQSAQQAVEAWAAYVNSQGGICGRKVVVDPYDDSNTSSGNYAAAKAACAKDFALVGGASGFDDGTASAVASCGIPGVAAELSTQAAGNTPAIYSASPGNAHYWPMGPPVYLARTYPNAVKQAASVYLNVPATEEEAQAQIATFEKVGFKYVYTVGVSPTEPNYAPYVQTMANDHVEYVTEWSDDNSAARLVQAMAQANFTPQVVDWNAEQYTPAFLKETGGLAGGELVLMATAPYEEASSNPGMELFLSWMNRVAPGFTHDIFAEYAWSAGLLFEQAAKAVGPHLTRAALLAQLGQIHQWTGGGVTPPVDVGSRLPNTCFSYFKVTSNGTGYARVYPPQPNSYDCTSGGLNHY